MDQSFQNKPFQPQKKDNRNLLIYLLLGVIALLLAATIFLLSYYLENSKRVSTKTQENQMMAMNRLELEAEYFRALDSLNMQRSDNSQLNDLIEQQKQELEGMKLEIEQKIAEGADAESLKREIAQMKSNTRRYLKEIEELKNDKARLEQRVREYSSQNEKLAARIRQKEQAIDSTATEAEAKAAEAERERQEKERLQSELASQQKDLEGKKYIMLNNLTLTAVKDGRKGKTSEVGKAKKADAYSICLSPSANPVAETGQQVFYVQLLNTQGTSIEIGTETIELTDGTEVRNVLPMEMDYDRTEQKLCKTWDPTDKLKSGDYTIVAYHRGVKVGESKLKLK